MSNEKNVTPKTIKRVPISEAKLVKLLDNIVESVVAEKKAKWIAEGEAKAKAKLDERVETLEKLVSEIAKKK